LHHDASAGLAVQHHCAEGCEAVDDKGREVFFAIDLEQQWSFRTERSLECRTQGWCEKSCRVIRLQSVFERFRVNEVFLF
jgi:hypothetical protein